MAVSSISNQNKIDLIKMALAKRNTNTQAAQQPSYMQKSGSIFLAPGAFKIGNNTQPQPTLSLNDDNITKALGEFKPATPQESEGTKDKNDPLAITGGKKSASAGKAAAADGQAKADDLKGQTKDVQDDAKTSANFEKYAAKLDKSIVKDDKKMKAELKKQEASFKSDTEEMNKLNEENEKLQKEIETAQDELASINTTTAFSVNGGGGNQDKVQELQEIIGAKVGKLQSNGKVVYSLQRNTQRTAKTMQSTSKQFVNIQKNNTKNIEKKEDATNNILKVANKVEEYSVLISELGKALDVGGQALVAIGAATSWAGVGAALISAGNLMQKVGKVTEMVGNFGQTAANLTKTAAFAAEGNLQGALQSAVGAVQTGAAGLKTAEGLKNGTTFGEINQSTNDAKQQLSAKVEAKAQVEQQQSAAMKDLAAEKNIDTKDMSDKEIKKALKEKGIKKDDINAKAFGKDSNGNVINAKQATNATKAQLQKENLNMGTHNEKFEDIDNTLKDKRADAFAKAKESGFKNVSKGTSKTSSLSASLTKLGEGGSAAAAMLDRTGNNSGATNTVKVKKPRPDTSGILNNSRMQRILASHRY